MTGGWSKSAAQDQDIPQLVRGGRAGVRELTERAKARLSDRIESLCHALGLSQPPDTTLSDDVPPAQKIAASTHA